MKKEILIDKERFLTRAAVLEDGELCEFYLEREGAKKQAGNIYKGRVQNVLPGMQAAFVDIGTGKNAFLYVGDAEPDKRDYTFGGDVAKAQPSIKKAVKNGQELLVQVVKEPDGDKGARITTHLTLPGRYVVLEPGNGVIGVSRRITSDEERQRLRKEAEKVCPQGMGLIVRTAAEGLNAEDFAQDVAYLTSLWSEIERAGKVRKAPCCVHEDENLVLRTVRDLMTDDVDKLILQDKQDVEAVKAVLRRISPALEGRVEQYAGGLPLFDVYRVEGKLDKALQRKVWLKNGGYLYFEQTEAMTVIDVNTGKFVGSHDLQDTVFRMNCEAAQEIARQVRLRDVGGIILIDFIDMEGDEHRRQLVEALKEAFKRDRNKTNIVGLTGLGLVEMTRKKMRSKLSIQMEKTCPTCGGTGRVLQEEHTARKALREAQRLILSGTTEGIVISVHPAVMKEVRRLSLGGVYLKEDAKKGPNDYHVSVEMKDVTDALEYLS